MYECKDQALILTFHHNLEIGDLRNRGMKRRREKDEKEGTNDGEEAGKG